MHGMKDVKFVNARQAKQFYHSLISKEGCKLPEGGSLKFETCRSWCFLISLQL